MNQNPSQTSQETQAAQTGTPSEKGFVSVGEIEQLRRQTASDDDRAFHQAIEKKLAQPHKRTARRSADGMLKPKQEPPVVKPAAADLISEILTEMDDKKVDAEDILAAIPSAPAPTEEETEDSPVVSPLFEASDGNASDDADDTKEDTDSDADEPTSDDDTDAADPVTPKKRRRWPLITAAAILFVVVGYLTVTFVPSGPIANLRDIYIQTAMSTADHQWLATAIFPPSVIAKSWTDPNVKPDDAPDGSEFFASDTVETQTPYTTDVTTEAPTTEEITETTAETEPSVPYIENDVLGLAALKVGDTDYAGNKVIIADVEEGLFVSEFTLTSTKLAPSKYHGYVMLIDDPSRVFVGSTPKPYVLGYRLGEMMDYYGDVVAGINASGFSDPNDCGTGGDIIGACFSEGKFWGNYTNTMASVVLTKDNKLVAAWLNDWSNYTTIRDGMQFGPVLVYKGENKIDKASGGGWGVHPRAAIGQREDGAIIMIVIDGRVTSSVGCTLWEMADMMIKYGAVTAGGCDGGSSVVLGYGDEILNENSSANPTYGRKMPNAFLVRSKKKED